MAKIVVRDKRGRKVALVDDEAQIVIIYKDGKDRGRRRPRRPILRRRDERERAHITETERTVDGRDHGSQ